MEDEILSSIGVVRDQEENILEKYLRSKSIKIVTGEPGRNEKSRILTSIGVIAQSIIENSLPEDFLGPEEFKVPIDEEPLVDSTTLKRKRAATKLLPFDHNVSTQMKRKKSSNNEKLANVMSQAASEMMDKKKKKTTLDARSYSCPICEKRFDYLDDNSVEVVVNKHLDRCLRKQNHNESFRPRFKEEKNSNVEEAENDTLSIENNSEEIERISDDHDESTEENGTLDVVDRFNTVGDDWEDYHFHERLQKLHSSFTDRTETSFGTSVHCSSWNTLYDYQKEGCKWLYSLYLDGMGGILADEMGLGKTAQVAVHLSSLGMLSQVARNYEQPIFLIVCPATVLEHWLQEMHRWAPFVRTGILHAISSTGKALTALASKDLLKVLKTLRKDKNARGIAVITSYEGIRKSKEVLQTVEWTAVCLDEGQKIRNPSTEITFACKGLPSFHRILLSGTPIQNSLKELWCLFDFTYPGRLGSLQAFEAEFAVPIRLGGYVNASKLQYEIAIRCAATLQRIIRPYLLRRKKSDLALIAKLPSKTEQVLFCNISDKQREIYKMILDSSEVKHVIMKRVPAFRAITTLRKLCNHPDLVYRHGKILWQQGGDDKPFSARDRKRNYRLLDDSCDVEEDETGCMTKSLQDLLKKSGSISGVSWSDSGKLLVLSKILPMWLIEGHKVLIFTQMVSVLYILEDMLKDMGFPYLSLDGTTPIGKRNEIIRTFNDNGSAYPVMLLTTRTGGVGISLTAANRVILFDPDWNPMTDIQARERAWRLGQTRDVTIYRLITRGTIEEKIYQRQIFKLLLSNRVLEDPKQKNLFSKSQIQELFTLTEDEAYLAKTTEFEFDTLPKEGSINLSKPAPFSESELNEQPLESLFDGEAITGVYNHSYLEPGNTTKSLSHNQYQIEKVADEFVEKAVKALQSSAVSYLNDAPSGTDKQLFGSNALITSGVSSYDIISHIRTNLKEGNHPTDSATVAKPLSLSERLKQRLLQLFEAKGEMSSQEVLLHFKDLGDQYAPIFKETLRSVAVLQGGKWKKREKVAFL